MTWWQFLLLSGAVVGVVEYRMRGIRDLFKDSLVQSASIDAALSAQNGRIKAVEDQQRETAAAVAELHGRVFELEQRPAPMR